MGISAQGIKSTIVDGLVIILPLGLMVFIGMKLVGMLRSVSEPLSQFLPENLRYPGIIAVVWLLFLSLIAGLLARTRGGKKAGHYIEASILSRIPGYSTVRSLTQNIRAEETEKCAPVFVEVEESLVLAFVIEVHDNGKYTIFIPSAPTPAAGTVYIMDASRVHFIDAPFLDAVVSVSKFGVGSANLIKSMRVSPSA